MFTHSLRPLHLVPFSPAHSQKQFGSSFLLNRSHGSRTTRLGLNGGLRNRHCLNLLDLLRCFSQALGQNPRNHAPRMFLAIRPFIHQVLSRHPIEPAFSLGGRRGASRQPLQDPHFTHHLSGTRFGDFGRNPIRLPRQNDLTTPDNVKFVARFTLTKNDLPIRETHSGLADFRIHRFRTDVSP